MVNGSLTASRPIKSQKASAQFRIFDKASYFAEISRAARACTKGDRLAFATMSFGPEDPGVTELIAAILQARRQGADVTLLVDSYIFLSQDRRRLGPLFYKARLSGHLAAPFRSKYVLLESLAKEGVKLAVTNMPNHRFSNIIGGRSHIKFGVINNRFFIGGCNLDNQTNLDLMVSCEQQKTADWLYEFSQKMYQSGGLGFMNNEDLMFKIDSSCQLLVDSGKRNQSIILDNALELIRHANKFVRLTCQFFPNNQTIHELDEAKKRGVDVQLYFNQARKMMFPFNLLHGLVELWEKIARNPSSYSCPIKQNQPYLHAKILVTESAVMIGSHNFVHAGVSLGTAEISLLSTDPDFIAQGRQYINQLAN